jgi:hypothetical protein
MSARAMDRLVWCLGMYASGSTWLFNAARATAQTLYPAARVNGLYAETKRALRLAPGAINVVKTHELPEDAAQHLTAQAERILLSLRDPRDAVTSLVQHMGEPFPRALARVEASARFATRLAAGPRTRLFIYESGFTEREDTFATLAAALGGTLTPVQSGSLFAATRRSKIEEKISMATEQPTAWRDRATGDVVDPDTQWHRHHAGRSGESGRWRSFLSLQQVAEIEQHLSGFMQDFGYPRESPAP